MADAEHSTAANLAQRKSGLPIWPAIAMTCAASTAVCLSLLAGGTDDGSRIEQQTMHVASAETETKPAQTPPSVLGNPQEIVEETRLAGASPSQFGLVKLFGFSANQIVLQRDAEIQKLLVETTSPPRVLTTGADDDLEPWVPLTPRSSAPFAL